MISMSTEICHNVGTDANWIEKHCIYVRPGELHNFGISLFAYTLGCEGISCFAIFSAHDAFSVEVLF